MWGTCGARSAARCSGRFIPTCVGNMRAAIFSTRRMSVHPHVCGEHSLHGVVRRFEWRFIPTCVGNILIPSPPNERSNGSSPRVWGTCRGGLRAGVRWRFIPTCVGNISLSPMYSNPAAVHPHVCGEHTTSPTAARSRRRFIPTCVGNMQPNRPGAWTPIGSSPRVWGTYTHIALLSALCRFIPTCVGNIH